MIPKNEKLPLQGVSFFFAEELKIIKRGEAENKVRSLGGYAKSSVVKDLSYLVTNEPESGKRKKAAELGVPVIDETSFLTLLEKASNQL
jgi:DNA ligase (NAD+)